MFVASRDIFPDADMVFGSLTIVLAVLLHRRSGYKMYKWKVVNKKEKRWDRPFPRSVVLTFFCTAVGPTNKMAM